MSNGFSGVSGVVAYSQILFNNIEVSNSQSISYVIDSCEKFKIL